MKAATALLAPLLLALVAAPHAAAELTLAVSTPAGRLVPEEPQAVRVEASVDCQWLLLQTSDTADVALTFVAEDPNIMVTGLRELRLSASPCMTDPTGTANAAADYHVVANRDALALQAWSVQVTARADPAASGMGLGAALSANASFPVVVEYFGLILVQAPITMDEAAPGHPALFHIDLQNRGNARSEVRFDVVGVAEDWQVQLPDSLVLGPPGSGNEQATASVSATGNRSGVWTNREAPFTLVVTPVSDEGAAGDPSEVSFLARTRGASTPMPLGFAVAGLAVAAWAARRP